jgi:hypothetical protein
MQKDASHANAKKKNAMNWKVSKIGKKECRFGSSRRTTRDWRWKLFFSGRGFDQIENQAVAG